MIQEIAAMKVRVGTKGPVEGENQDLGRERYCSADPALGTRTHVTSA